VPSQQLATLSTAKDEGFKPFWLRHASLRARLSLAIKTDPGGSHVKPRSDKVNQHSPSAGCSDTGAWPSATARAAQGSVPPPAGDSGKGSIVTNTSALFGIYRWGWGFSTSQDFNGDIALIACFASWAVRHPSRRPRPARAWSPS
jgi:hypothetical protein